MVGFPNKPMGFPTKNDHFGCFGGKTHHLRKHPYNYAYPDAPMGLVYYTYMKTIKFKPFM